MKKVKTNEEIEDEFNNLTRKRNQLIVELDKTTKELVTLAEQIYENSPEYVKIICIRCNGKGSIDTDDGKHLKCPVCQLKGYMWAKRFEDDKSSEL